jgi:hypothetical protein
MNEISRTKKEQCATYIVNGSHLSKEVKAYCKYHKLKFKEYTENGFIASQLTDIKAGMEYNPNNGKLISIPIRKIGSKMIYTAFICYSDKDIVDNGRVFNYP